MTETVRCAEGETISQGSREATAVHVCEVWRGVERSGEEWRGEEWRGEE